MGSGPGATSRCGSSCAAWSTPAPPPSGHRTPTVIASLPLLGLDEATVTAGGWMVQQAVAQGVHGAHLTRARDPERVKAIRPGRPRPDPQAGH